MQGSPDRQGHGSARGRDWANAPGARPTFSIPQPPYRLRCTVRVPTADGRTRASCVLLTIMMAPAIGGPAGHATDEPAGTVSGMVTVTTTNAPPRNGGAFVYP